VDTVLEGSALQPAHGPITAQLIRNRAERHGLGEELHGGHGRHLQLQGSVARAVAEGVEAALTPKEVARLTRPRPANPEATRVTSRRATTRPLGP